MVRKIVVLRPQKKKERKKERKKEKRIPVLRVDRPSKYGQLVRTFFLILVFLSAGKNDSPKNNKISQSLTYFREKFWEKSIN